MPFSFLGAALVAATLVSQASISSAATIGGNILVIARDNASVAIASNVFTAYGIPCTTLIVPQEGAALPTLNSSSGGNFAGFVVVSDVSYNTGNNTGNTTTSNWQSVLTDDQWNQIFDYQTQYRVRMIQYDVYPGPLYGTVPVSTGIGVGCCGSGVEQNLFPTAGLKTQTGAGVSTIGLWHYPASITNTNTTKEIAQFAANSQFNSTTTAGVINNFGGREQMVFFTSMDTSWSSTSTFIQHAWVHWLTRGLYAGYRRVNINTQIDDMFQPSEIYLANTTFRISTADLDGISAWIPQINAKMNTGSNYFPEICHSGNGNIKAAANASGGNSLCGPGAIEYGNIPGTGTNRWPATPTTYNWSDACLNLDPLKIWWSNSTNLNKYAHISHTFTDENEDNATYSDVYKEISFNIVWLNRTGISSANRFTANGLVPPGITGLYNADALRAWMDNGLTNCVGDNTRPILTNQQNPYWPLISTVLAGIQINPRWATRIYYNCDTSNCTTQKWINTSNGTGDFYALLAAEKADTMRHFFGLRHDPYMFHQANLRNTGVPSVTINGVTAQLSLFQSWAETIVQEFVRLVDWPLISQKHGDMSTAFAARAARDACGYSISWTVDADQITGVTVSSNNGSTCNSPIPVTFPVSPTSTLGFPTEQIGNDPLTVWVSLTGNPVSMTLSTPISFNLPFQISWKSLGLLTASISLEPLRV
ncbi:hypothetical protein V8E54_009715 [Elaphomyces granulatus]